MKNDTVAKNSTTKKVTEKPNKEKKIFYFEYNLKTAIG